MVDGSKSGSFWSQFSSGNMVFQVQEETWLYYQEIQGKLLCKKECTEEDVSWTLELVFLGVTVVHSEVNVDFWSLL